MIVTFCGHGTITYTDETRKLLRDTIEKLISEGAHEFLLGGYGAFDVMAANAVKDLKAKYPHIKSVLVVPYLDSDVDRDLYDCSEYPPIERVPKRFAISKRNEWMVDQADVVVAYVDHDWGGAAKTLKRAVSKKKRIINIANS